MSAIQGLIFLQLFLVSTTHGLLGYDCGSRTLNVTSISLLEVGECDLPNPEVNVTKQYIQLLQINEYAETRVQQCKVEVHRTIYYCGMHSHVSIISNGEAEYLSEISREACVNAHESGILKYGETKTIQGLKINQTITHSITFAGFLNSDGKCNGASFADPYGSWESVVVQGTIKITLTEYTSRVSLDNDVIHLRSGTACSLSAATCIDIEGGQTFWDPIPKDKCKFNRYGVLYTGKAYKLRDEQGTGPQIVYSVESQGTTFSLAARSHENICGYTLIRTEHPKLVIFETIAGDNFVERRVSVANLDLFSYINSKFVYVEKFIRNQIKQLYRDVVLHRCNLERQALKNSLAIATQSPDEFAFHFMKGPGYMALVAGEVIHVVKCVPVEVRIEPGTECYGELQVSHKNRTFFLTPRTHILKTMGTKIPCNSLLPSYYRIGELWYRVLPKLTESIPPSVIKPQTSLTWKYIDPSHLATSGIYSEEELKDLKEMLMFPVEKPSLLNDLAREMNGRPMVHNEGSLSRLLTEDTVERIAQTAWDRMWSRFMSFGTVSAGIIAIMMMVQFFKALVSIVIRGYTLHTVYGWSIHLLGAIWSSIAHLLLHLGQQQQHQPDVEARENQDQPIPRAPMRNPEEVPLQELELLAPKPYQQLRQDLAQGGAFNMPR